ncbi:TIGR02757 family protein [bacterium]|nr:TIGR02757 family protein [bacterium]
MNSINTNIEKSDTLHDTLDGLYRRYQNGYLSMDPLELARQYEDSKDQEIAAFISAGLAIGRYDLIRRAVQMVLDCMKPSPYRFVQMFDPSRDGAAFRDFRYRFYQGRDIQLLIWWIAQMIRRAGSIKQFFLNGYSASDSNIGFSLSRFVRSILDLTTAPFYSEIPPRGVGIRHFLADPLDGSGCKRLNLFLRWMVRKDALDLGLWPEVSTSQLVIPLDTHIIRFGRYLGLTGRVSPGWNMALEITETLRRFDASDPVKYDFAICTLGKLTDCSNPPDRIKCRTCPIFRCCRNAV